MSEQEKIDHLLHTVMSAVPPPTLSPGFDRKVSRRLRSSRLSATGRLVLSAYIVVATGVSVWTMRIAAIDWNLIAIAVLVPLVLVATVRRRGALRVW